MKLSRLSSIGAAGAVALGSLILTAPIANAMTFGDACGITKGWLAQVPAAGIEECHWQDPNTGNEWIRTNPVGNTPPTPNGTPFGQACVITQGWVATVVAAGIEECHWQDPGGNEHVISNPLPKKNVPPVGPVKPPPASSRG